tara:strand:+ start:476 stop:787 length:312 start_codon:yes stop_codon:yes gene_type:complete
MTHTLIQKHLLHGTQSFELKDDVIKVKINSLFKGKKELDIDVAILNPEPVISKTHLHFHSRVKCGPLISLYLNKPNAEEFNAFVDAVKAKAQLEFDIFSGLKK